jgi:DNA invertase Pin-like site-specific DNA recombinase
MTDRAYARISLDTAASGSITKQRSRLARAADGEPIFYVDESVSGSKIPFADRPAGKSLLADLAKGDRVLVTKIDRAARNVTDLLGLVERIERAGASIVFVDQNIDTAGPMGRFLLTLLGAVAELEAAIVAERRRESLASFREEGRHAVGRAPYGLRSVPNPNGRGLVLRPDPATAPILREVVERFLAGEPQRSLASVVGMGRPAFGRLLRNARLAGVIDSGPDGIRLDEAQAIFSPGEWARLQEVLGKPGEKPHRQRTEGYGPAFVCQTCGERLYLNLSKRNPAYSVYRCRGLAHASGEPAVSVMRMNADALVEAEFLARFGRLPVTDLVEVGSSETRDSAVALARMNLDAIKAAQDMADDEAEEEALFAAYRKAKRALRQAEAVPTEARFEAVESGQSFAEVWAEANHETRTALLLRLGPWIVAPGRLPLDRKVTLREIEPDYLAGQVDDSAA